MNNNKTTSEVVNFMRFPLIVGVVFIHAGWGTHPMIDMQSGVMSEMWWTNLVVRVMSKMIPAAAVPLFFLFSGYYFFKGTENGLTMEMYGKKLRSRAVSLLMPFVIWSVIDVLVKYRMESWIPLIERDGLTLLWNCKTLEPGDVNIIGQTIVNAYPHLVPMWFVRDLIVMAVLSPLIYYGVKRGKEISVGVLGLCCMTKVWPDIAGLGMMGATSWFYFSLGAYLRLNSMDIVDTAIRLKKVAVCVYVFLLVMVVALLDKSSVEIIVMQIFTLSGVIVYVNVAAWIVGRRKWQCIDLLSGASFFIYSLHTIYILTYCKIAMKALTNPMGYVAASLLCVGVCLLLYTMLKKMAPALLFVLTGRKEGSKISLKEK